MESKEGDEIKTDSEVKQKKPGFFKRFKRRVSSIFLRKRIRKRNNSEPCLPNGADDSQQPELKNETRLSLNEETEKPEENVDKATPSDFRPAAKAPIFVNDFTAELKKSLKMRSKMVEEGQTSDAIMQIEMTRSTYSVSEDEEQIKEAENKTFEEKLALFESQISGGSLNRGEKQEENKSDENAVDDVDDIQGFIESDVKETVEDVSINVLNPDNASHQDIKSDENAVDMSTDENITSYELMVTEEKVDTIVKEDNKETEYSHSENKHIIENIGKIKLESDEDIVKSNEMVSDNDTEILEFSEEKRESVHEKNENKLQDLTNDMDVKDKRDSGSSDYIQGKPNINDDNERLENGILINEEVLINENHHDSQLQ